LLGRRVVVIAMSLGVGGPPGVLERAVCGVV
jgi:hypothetical protein